MIRSEVLIQYTRVTDRRTDGRNWRSTYRAQHSVARQKRWRAFNNEWLVISKCSQQSSLKRKYTPKPSSAGNVPDRGPQLYRTSTPYLDVFPLPFPGVFSPRLYFVPTEIYSMPLAVGCMVDVLVKSRNTIWNMVEFPNCVRIEKFLHGKTPWDASGKKRCINMSRKVIVSPTWTRTLKHSTVTLN